MALAATSGRASGSPGLTRGLRHGGGARPAWWRIPEGPCAGHIHRRTHTERSVWTGPEACRCGAEGGGAMGGRWRDGGRGVCCAGSAPLPSTRPSHSPGPIRHACGPCGGVDARAAVPSWGPCAVVSAAVCRAMGAAPWPGEHGWTSCDRAQHTAAWIQLRPHSTLAVLPASPRPLPARHGPMCHQRRGSAITATLKPGHGRMGGALSGWPSGSRPSPHAHQCRWPGPHPFCPDTATATATATAIAASARCTAWRPLSRPWA